MQGAGVRPWFFTQKAQYGSLRRPVLACIGPVLPPKIISSYKEIRDLPRTVRVQRGKEIGMTRIAGAFVLAVIVFVSFYVPFAFFAIQRRMKTRQRRRDNSLPSLLLSRYPSKPVIPSNPGDISLEPKVSPAS
jgi:hypothetical protein